MAEDLTKSLKSVAEEIKASTAKISAESARNAELAGAEKKKSTEEIKTLSTELSELVKTQNSLQEKLSGLKGLDKLNQTLKDQKTDAKLDLDVAELGNKLKGLNSFFGESNEASKELLEQFKLQKEILQNPEASEEEKTLAEKTIKTISEGAQTEEDRREAAKKAEEANSILSQMASGLDGLGSKFDKFSNNFKKGAGFLGTLGAIGLLLFDPETLKNMVIGVIEFFEDMYATVQAIFAGDSETYKSLIKENL
jgi:small-conductance mechanosensitive channel